MFPFEPFCLMVLASQPMKSTAFQLLILDFSPSLLFQIISVRSSTFNISPGCANFHQFYFKNPRQHYLRRYSLLTDVFYSFSLTSPAPTTLNTLVKVNNKSACYLSVQTPKSFLFIQSKSQSLSKALQDPA